MSGPSPIHIIEKTFFAAWSLWGGLHGPLYSSGSVCSVKTGIASADLNMAWNEEPLREDDRFHLQIIKEDFRRAGLPFWWWVFPHAQGPFTSALLQEEGFFLVETIPSFLADLATPPAVSIAVDSLRIVPVHHEENLRLWEDVSFQAFDFPVNTRSQYRKFLDALDLTQGAPQELFLAFFDEQPAATAMLFLEKDAGGIYFVSTLSKYRRQGIGLAVTLAAMDKARLAGARYATLQSSPEGLSVYRQAGFREYCRVQVYRV